MAAPTLLLGGISFWLGLRISRMRLSPTTTTAIFIASSAASLPGIVFALYYFKVFHEPVWLYEFRSVPFSELAASGAGLLAGLLHGRLASSAKFQQFAGKALFPGVLVIGLSIPYLKPLIRPLNRAEIEDNWADGVCLQSTSSTCGPSCAATLLKAAGKPATELSLAIEAMSSSTGTENWYLARALRNRGMQVGYVYQKVRTNPLPSPAIAGVRLRGEHSYGHFIALIGERNGKYEVGDPMKGRLQFTAEELEKEYEVTGFFMVVTPRQ